MTDPAKLPATLDQDAISAAVGGYANNLPGNGLDAVTLSGTTGRDDLHGGMRDDRIDGGDAEDFLVGWAGNDTVFGGSGHDVIGGMVGHDSLVGGTGDDSIAGSDGDDTLIGGFGADTLLGGQGNDLYIWSPGDGDQRIADSDGTDTLRLLNTGLTMDQLRNALTTYSLTLQGWTASTPQLPVSEDGTKLLVSGMYLEININGETIIIEGLDTIELVNEAPTRSVGSATG